jgi:hypothetical protein
MNIGLASLGDDVCCCAIRIEVKAAASISGHDLTLLRCSAHSSRDQSQDADKQFDEQSHVVGAEV